ncbi:50S ribosomal protein L11 methyltransferase [Ruminococcaceae bacterium OttesenSCG-928-O06]|nr:50S ribosomal protein L11 methyltransferase [Ruminococcaceae bacterium OttesenSCG-928-O06]
MYDWTEFTITAPRHSAQAAQDVATAFSDAGLYIEDYADLEEGVRTIAHVDLIDEDLLQKPRDEIRIHLYVSREENPAAALEALRARLLAAGVAHTLKSHGIRQEDWENSWKQYYHPLEIGRRLAVAPSWEPYTGAGRTVLRLDPGMAFGTGTHETTALCLEALDELVRSDEDVLDVGCGSGILAVAALLLGAKSALGIDIDPMAVRTATENAQLNGVTARFTAKAGDLARLAKGPYHIITANIIADAIIRLAPAVPALLSPGGYFIASGIIDTREEETAAALAAAGLAVQKTCRRRGWVAFWATAPGG